MRIPLLVLLTAVIGCKSERLLREPFSGRTENIRILEGLHAQVEVDQSKNLFLLIVAKAGERPVLLTSEVKLQVRYKSGEIEDLRPREEREFIVEVGGEIGRTAGQYYKYDNFDKLDGSRIILHILGNRAELPWLHK